MQNLRKSNILSYSYDMVMVFGLDSLIQQIVPATIDSFGVWIPLAFGLVVGLAFVIASAARRSK
jgi:hypothetical protein